MFTRKKEFLAIQIMHRVSISNLLSRTKDHFFVFFIIFSLDRFLSDFATKVESCIRIVHYYREERECRPPVHAIILILQFGHGSFYYSVLVQFKGTVLKKKLPSKFFRHFKGTALKYWSYDLPVFLCYVHKCTLNLGILSLWYIKYW